jgi:sulfonate transport system substrate-binding protein
MFRSVRRTLSIVALVATLVLASGACSSGGTSSSGKVALRLGYYANITHASAIIGVDKGIFARDLGAKVDLQTKIFNAGPDVVTALFAGALDASYIGPNPAINAYAKSNGEAVRIVSGATSGGAFLVVKPSITSAADLKGKKLASPQLGNTQDVALRAWLDSKGLKTTTAGGGDVNILPQENSQTLDTFKTGQIDGAWVPEPWASRLVIEGGGHVLVDERDLWPGGKYVTTQLIVRTAFLQQHPDVVENLVRGQVDANDYIKANPDAAKIAVGAGIEKITGKTLKPEVLDQAWKNLAFTDDPLVSSLQQEAAASVRFGFIKTVDLSHVYDLTILNKILKEKGEAEVSTG